MKTIETEMTGPSRIPSGSKNVCHLWNESQSALARPLSATK